MTSCSMWQSSFMKAEPEGIINTSYNQKLNLCEDGWEISNVIGQQNLNYKKSLWSQKT